MEASVQKIEYVDVTDAEFLYGAYDVDDIPTADFDNDAIDEKYIPERLYNLEDEDEDDGSEEHSSSLEPLGSRAGRRFRIRLRSARTITLHRTSSAPANTLRFVGNPQIGQFRWTGNFFHSEMLVDITPVNDVTCNFYFQYILSQSHFRGSRRSKKDVAKNAMLGWRLQIIGSDRSSVFPEIGDIARQKFRCTHEANIPFSGNRRISIPFALAGEQFQMVRITPLRDFFKIKYC